MANLESPKRDCVTRKICILLFVQSQHLAGRATFNVPDFLSLSTNICIIHTCWWGFYSANTLNFCMGQWRNPSNIVIDTMNIVLVSHTAHCQRWQGNLGSWVPAGFHQFVPLSQASTCIYLRAESGEPNSHLTHLTWICEQSNNGKRQSCMLLRRGAITVWCNSHKPGRDVTSSDTATIPGRSLLFQSLLQIHFSEYL